MARKMVVPKLDKKLVNIRYRKSIKSEIPSSSSSLLSAGQIETKIT